MMDYIWAGMILGGILYGSLTGRMEQLTSDVLNASGEAVSLCITMLGIISFWMGLMNVAKKAGLLDLLTKCLQPLVNFLFPNLPKNHEARTHISTNLLANILGLGWACTPAGLKAMEALAKLEEERREVDAKIGCSGPKKKGMMRNAKEEGVASKEMCDFLILNISSLQLIPVSVIAYRMQYGSPRAAAIIGPAILATCVSTLTAIIYIRLKK